MSAVTISTELLNHFEDAATVQRESAKRALLDVIQDAQAALARLEGESPTVRQSIGGSCLNEQRWQDAERSLVRFWDAASTAAILRQEAGR
jgi:hypothetical protein